MIPEKAFAWLAWFAIGAIVGAIIARVREQDVVGGAVLSAILGPIGWLILLLRDDDRPKCSECGGRMVFGAKRCRHCGEQRKPPAPPVPRPEVKIPAEAYVICPGCTRGSFRGSKTCGHCGRPLP